MPRLIADSLIRFNPPARLGSALLVRWSHRSVAAARRNADAGLTACTARRTERLEVEEYIHACLAARAAG